MIITKRITTTTTSKASAVVDAYIFEIDKIEALGVLHKKFKVCTYDFFAYHYSADFEGFLGLDFLKCTKFCIDLDEQEITLLSKK